MYKDTNFNFVNEIRGQDIFKAIFEMNLRCQIDR